MVSLPKLLFHPLTALGVTVVAGLFMGSLYSTWQRSLQTTQRLEELDRQLERSNAEVMQLQTQLQATSQAQTKDKLIRNTLLMQKPGEYVVQVPLPNTPDETSNSITTTMTPWEEWQKLVLD